VGSLRRSWKARTPSWSGPSVSTVSFSEEFAGGGLDDVDEARAPVDAPLE